MRYSVSRRVLTHVRQRARGVGVVVRPRVGRRRQRRRAARRLAPAAAHAHAHVVHLHTQYITHRHMIHSMQIISVCALNSRLLLYKCF